MILRISFSETNQLFSQICASNIEEATQTPITLFYIKNIVKYTKFIIYIIIKLKKSNKFVFIINLKN